MTSKRTVSASAAATASHVHDDLRGEPLRTDDIDAFRQALSAAGLPAADIVEPDVRPFRFTRRLIPVGYGALEVYGPDALLRSIVVTPDARGDGVGRKIVDRLLAEASGLRALRAFLFTTDARAYFEGLGFEAVDRRIAPPSILVTRQAIGLCPASATLLARLIEPSHRPGTRR